MACDVDQLLEDGKCYACLSPKQRAMIRIALLCAIVAVISGGGGSGGGVLRGVGSPEGVQMATAASVYYDTASGTFWIFNGTFGTATGWLEVIA